jgi:hypothetical protein
MFFTTFISERNQVLVIRLIIIILSDGKTWFRKSPKKWFSYVDKSTHSNLIFHAKSGFSRLFVSERNQVLVIRLIIIILSDGKTWFRNVDAIAILIFHDFFAHGESIWIFSQDLCILTTEPMTTIAGAVNPVFSTC